MSHWRNGLDRRAWMQGLALLLLVQGRSGHAASLLGVRIWPARDYTRVTIESDAPLQTQVQFVEEPPRLAVDIQGLVLDESLRNLVRQVRPDDPYIAGIRAGQFTPTVVRLVFDLRQPVKPQWLNLPPVEAVYQHRLLLDLYPTQPVDPLDALIAELKPASAHDPIADIWIRNQGKPAAP